MEDNTYVSITDKLRQEKNAPCAKVYFSDIKKREVVEYPNIRCGYDCDHCGWNPKVKQARIEKMLAELTDAKKRKKKGRKKNGDNHNAV